MWQPAPISATHMQYKVIGATMYCDNIQTLVAHTSIHTYIELGELDMSTHTMRVLLLRIRCMLALRYGDLPPNTVLRPL